jgi:hypothetical protein
MLLKLEVFGFRFEFERNGGTFLRIGRFNVHMTRENDLFDWLPVVDRMEWSSPAWEAWWLGRHAYIGWA